MAIISAWQRQLQLLLLLRVSILVKTTDSTAGHPLVQRRSDDMAVKRTQHYAQNLPQSIPVYILVTFDIAPMHLVDGNQTFV